MLSHVRALLTSSTAPTAYIDADARDTAKILAEASDLLDLGQPTAVMLIAVLHGLPDSGLELPEPGVVAIQDWRADSALDFDSPPTAMWGGVGLKT